MTPDEKKAAKAKLLADLMQMRADTISHWLQLFEAADEDYRKHSGFTKGADDMIRRLAKDYRAKEAKMMKPFDRGDFDE